MWFAGDTRASNNNNRGVEIKELFVLNCFMKTKTSRLCSECFTAPSPWLLHWGNFLSSQLTINPYPITNQCVQQLEKRVEHRRGNALALGADTECFTNPGSVKWEFFLFHCALPSSGARPPAYLSRQGLTMGLTQRLPGTGPGCVFIGYFL